MISFVSAKTNGRFDTFVVYTDFGSDCTEDFFIQLLVLLGTGLASDRRLSFVQSVVVKDFNGILGPSLEEGQHRGVIILKMPETVLQTAQRSWGSRLRDAFQRIAELGGAPPAADLSTKLEGRLRPVTPMVSDFINQELRTPEPPPMSSSTTLAVRAGTGAVCDPQWVAFYGQPLNRACFRGPWGLGPLHVYSPKKLTLEEQGNIVQASWTGGKFSDLQDTVLDLVAREWLPPVTSQKYQQNRLVTFAEKLGVAVTKLGPSMNCVWCSKRCKEPLVVDEAGFCGVDCLGSWQRQLVCIRCSGTVSVLDHTTNHPEALKEFRYPWACYECDGDMEPRKRGCRLSIPSLNSIRSSPY
jgi:hypothetical protein